MRFSMLLTIFIDNEIKSCQSFRQLIIIFDYKFCELRPLPLLQHCPLRHDDTQYPTIYGHFRPCSWNLCKVCGTFVTITMTCLNHAILERPR